VSAPDALVLLRALAGVPILLLIRADQPIVALALFIAAALSDALDGFLARRSGIAGSRGALLDPLADKVLVVMVLAALASTAQVPAVFAQLVALREGAVAALRIIAYRRHAAIGTGLAAKIKTALELAAIALLIASRPASAVSDVGVLLLALALAIGLATLPMYVPRDRKPVRDTSR
jgi:CDP-diacylglycerol--glycerol-3-phosphate 3-phosphatidyltransferase